MDAEKTALIVAAIESLAEKAGGSIAQRPDASAIEAEIGGGFVADAAEMEAAWKSFDEAKDGEGEKASAPTPSKRKGAAKGGKAPVVTNHYTSPMAFDGVLIPPGESRPVPGFDAARPLVKRWAAAGVLSVD